MVGALDSGQGFETYQYWLVSFSKAHLLPIVLASKEKAVPLSRHD